ncbi:MAG: type 2 isopentenyl-diphosphate Delta-isomerase [Bacteriovoracaceae bacterium]|nr:type 2 isopentenyl-diphosphate Delta-isomerase [Bacteriovoracaceae bacterium]
MVTDDQNSSKRKDDHLELALSAQLCSSENDNRFYYEPMLSAHPNPDLNELECEFLDKKIGAPIWISSMTGGSVEGRRINENLARVAKKHSLPMALGSCRSLLDSDERFEDFNMRPILGDLPLWANLGIAQVEKLIEAEQENKILELVEKLSADGLIIHVNPLQEWIQPEGDHIKYAPVETIKKCLELLNLPLIVKEVGQGMGPSSLRALMELPLSAIEFGAFGGTNFSLMEGMRGDETEQLRSSTLATLGHTAEEMVCMVNTLLELPGTCVKCREFIISGGVKGFLDGQYLIKKIGSKAVFGQAGTLLKYARVSFEALDEYIEGQIEGLKLANSFTHLKK